MLSAKFRLEKLMEVPGKYFSIFLIGILQMALILYKKLTLMGILTESKLEKAADFT